MSKDNPHDEQIRSVIAVAHQVRLRLHDSQVIFGSVIPSRDDDAETPSAGGNAESFAFRPWGVSTPTTIKYDDVWRAAPVTEMVWERQKAISMAQFAGIFAELT